tara:strand:- start:152 stop:958 length:807 start_codon:yes stop_codon:yes gene_type:complete
MSGSNTNIFNMNTKQDTTKTDLENVKNNDTTEQTNSPVIKKMTTEEYKTQGSDYTTQALAELQQQMQNADIKRSANSSNSPRSKKRRVDDHREYLECDDDDYIDSDDEDEKPKYTDNLLIQNARYRTGIPTTSRTSSSNRNAVNTVKADLYMQLLGQREIDIQENIKLKAMVVKLEAELEKRDMQEHYMKLDLNNTTVERDLLKADMETHVKRVKEYKEKHNKEFEELKNTNKNLGFRYTICKWIVFPISFAINAFFMAVVIKESYHQ